MAGNSELYLINIEFQTDYDSVKRVFKATSGGYFVYIVCPGVYIPVSTESLLCIDSSGKITHFEIYQWNVGHGIEQGDFAEGFIGKELSDIDSVELVTGATTISSDLHGAVKAALEIVTSNILIEDSIVFPQVPIE